MPKDAVVIETRETEPLMGASRALPWYKTPSLLTIGVVGLILGFTAMRVSVEETILFAKACDNNMVDGVCDPTQNQLMVGTYQQWSLFVKNVTLITALCYIHSKMGKVGRKPIIIGLAFTTALGPAVFLATITYFREFKFKLLLFSGFLSNLAGGAPGFQGIVSAYVTDITTLENRQTHLALVFSCIVGSQLLSQFTGSQIAIWGERMDYSPRQCDLVIYSLALVVGAVGVLYTLVLPESMGVGDLSDPGDPGDPGDSTDALGDLGSNELGDSAGGGAHRSLHRSLRRMFVGPLRLLTLPTEDIPEEMRHRATQLRFSVFVIITCSVASVVDLNPVIFQYGIYKFQWQSQHISVFMMIVAFAGLIDYAVLVPVLSKVVLQRWFGFKTLHNRLDNVDYGLLLLGLMSQASLLFGLAVSQSTAQVYTLFSVFVLGPGLSPASVAALTKFYKPSRIGQVFMSTSILTSIVSVAVPPLLLQLYKVGLVHGLPSIPFFVCSGVNVAIFGLFILDRCWVLASGRAGEQASQ